METDRSLKYNGEYLRVKLDNLEREYAEQRADLSSHHHDALTRWPGQSAVSIALKAAYTEELQQLKTSVLQKLRETHQEIRELLANEDVRSKWLRDTLHQLETRTEDFFRKIQGTALTIILAVLLRSKDLL